MNLEIKVGSSGESEKKGMVKNTSGGEGYSLLEKIKIYAMIGAGIASPFVVTYLMYRK